MVKAGRKSAFIRDSGLFVAYGNDKRLFYPQKSDTKYGRHPSRAVCRIYIAFM